MAVIEMLRAKCVSGRRQEWLVRDAEVWTPALAAHDGFISKAVWPSIDNPDEVVIIVHWESLPQWKSFPKDLEAALDAKMAGLQLAVTSEALETYSG